jgi:glycosyltransferase involved in cell wall biosynthesis
VKSPLVSIITPSYNQGRFIRATIESVLAQDYPRIEYIIMDGGSTDETAGVVREYSGRLQWYSEKDRGQSHAINKGFRMAKGEIVSWLNSDDVILPGAVGRAVHAFENNPRVGAVYGEGYQMDIDGKIKCRFPATEPFDLWKLIYLWDFILQQTSYFRRSVFDEIGLLDESLHWGMDWDIFIRIAKRYPLKYIPEYMGCIREYDAAKSFSGGSKRFRELARLMRKHGGLRYPPGYIIYGLDTFSSMLCNRIEALTPRWMDGFSRQVRRALRGVADLIIVHTSRTAQGLYSDGWAAPELKYMLGPGSGTVVVKGTLPDFVPDLRNQELIIRCNREEVARASFSRGDFDFSFKVPTEVASQPADFRIRASNSFVPGVSGVPGAGNDFRRLSYKLKSFAWAEYGVAGE